MSVREYANILFWPVVMICGFTALGWYCLNCGLTAWAVTLFLWAVCIGVMAICIVRARELPWHD